MKQNILYLSMLIPAIVFIIEAFFFGFKQKRFPFLLRSQLEFIVLIVYPIVFFHNTLHQGFYVSSLFILLVAVSYFASTYRVNNFKAGGEIVVNMVLIGGLIVNALSCYKITLNGTNEALAICVGHCTYGILIVIELLNNLIRHKKRREINNNHIVIYAEKIRKF